MTNENESLPHVDIYIDGSCFPNPGLGGIGAVLIYGSHKRELSESVGRSTNIRAEMTAAIRALQMLNRPCQVTIYTDLQYLVKTMEGDYRRGKNVDLWVELDDAGAGHTVRWRWIRGHDGNRHNERAHVLANEGRLKRANGNSHMASFPQNEKAANKNRSQSPESD